MKSILKKLALLLVVGLAMGALMTSCSPDDGEEYFDELVRYEFAMRKIVKFANITYK